MDPANPCQRRADGNGPLVCRSFPEQIYERPGAPVTHHMTVVRHEAAGRGNGAAVGGNRTPAALRADPAGPRSRVSVR